MVNLSELIRDSERKIRTETRKGVDNYSGKNVENFPNGERFVNDGSVGYVLDLDGNVKCWYVRDGLIGGESGWVEAEFSHGDFIGPEGDYGLHRKKGPVFGFDLKSQPL